MLELHVQCRPVYNLFPDISPNYVNQLFTEHGGDTAAVINFIMDEVEQKRPYPTRQEASLKRKRAVDNIDDESDSETEADARMTALRQKYDNPQRRAAPVTEDQVRKTKDILNKQFMHISEDIVVKYMKENNNLLLPSYLAMEKILRNWASYPTKPWRTVSEEVALVNTQLLTNLASDTTTMKRTVGDINDPGSAALYKELLCAGRIRGSRIKKALQKDADKPVEDIHDDQTQHEWLISECQCCFTETPYHRMVFCDGKDEHMFCVDCARRNAEAQIGLSRYALTCMATDGCSGGFCRIERTKFLSRKLSHTLDCLESEDAVLRAGLDLESCPFCNFAAEAGSTIEEDREFRCLNPDCMTVSCRICHKKTHTPLTCEEAKEGGTRSARITIEEAMSDAVIRSCNKCKTPFMKESGCNKMTCPKPACRNVQCYICSKNCDYNHFAERHKRPGIKCPLYDEGHIDNLHDQEMKRAQEETTKAVQAERPDIDPHRLEILMSDKVKEDDERRRNRPYHRPDRPPNQARAIEGMMQEYEDQVQRRRRLFPPLPNYPGIPPAPPAAAPRHVGFAPVIPVVENPPLAANPIPANPVPANPTPTEPIPANSQRVRYNLRPPRLPIVPRPQFVRQPPAQPQESRPARQQLQKPQNGPQEETNMGHGIPQGAQQGQQARGVGDVFEMIGQPATHVVTPASHGLQRLRRGQVPELMRRMRRQPNQEPEFRGVGDYRRHAALLETPLGLPSMNADGPPRPVHNENMAPQARNGHRLAAIALDEAMSLRLHPFNHHILPPRSGPIRPLLMNPRMNMDDTVERLRRSLRSVSTGPRVATSAQAEQRGAGAP